MKLKRQRTGRKKKVVILFHTLESIDKSSYFSVEHAEVDSQAQETAEYLQQVFDTNGYRTRTIALETGDVSKLSRLRADLIFNLVDTRAMEVKILKILDRMGIPYTGSGLTAVRISNNKIKSKKIMLKNGIPTPRYTLIRPSERISRKKVPGKFPVIVKPAFEHCSVGITEESVATSYVRLKELVADMKERFKQTLLIEEFIRGHEVHVTVMEAHNSTVALPVARMTFMNGDGNKWNIFGYREKWDDTSRQFWNCRFESPVTDIPAHDARRMKRDAIRAFYAFKFRDYARFDVRYNPDTGGYFFLEGNANAGISNSDDDAMTVSLKAYGMSLDDFVMMIANNSLSH